jgi:hypothetical protein
MKYDEFFNSVLTKILKMTARFFRIFYFKNFKFNRLIFGQPTKPTDFLDFCKKRWFFNRCPKLCPGPAPSTRTVRYMGRN